MATAGCEPIGQVTSDIIERVSAYVALSLRPDTDDAGMRCLVSEFINVASSLSQDVSIIRVAGYLGDSVNVVTPVTSALLAEVTKAFQGQVEPSAGMINIILQQFSNHPDDARDTLAQVGRSAGHLTIRS